MLPAMPFDVRPTLRAASRAVLDALLPPLCLGCGEIVGEPGALCAQCWAKLELIAPPYCACCGRPFGQDVGADALCGPCLARPPRYRRARAVFRYADPSRGLVLTFKHSDRTEGAPAFGRWLARAGADLLADADFVTPVPLHRRRLILRRYNQSALLAQAAARAAGKVYAPDILYRRRNTASQQGLGARERKRNVAGAFAVSPSWAAHLRGKQVVLVDDVFTTGATVDGCVRALRRGGAAAVDVLTLARAVRPEAPGL